jgi:hypothetical protein
MEDSQEVNLETAAEEAAKDEEYKLMYHQTYKAAAFAFVSANSIHCYSSPVNKTYRGNIS